METFSPVSKVYCNDGTFPEKHNSVFLIKQDLQRVLALFQNYKAMSQSLCAILLVLGFSPGDYQKSEH